MSKSRKRKANTPSQSVAAAPAQTEKDALHQPIKPVAAEKSPMRARIDRALPPFSLQRYLAIWVLGMIPLVGLLVILLHPWDVKSVTSTVTPTATTGKLVGTPTVALTSTPVITVTLSLSPTAVTGQVPGVGANVAEVNKFLVIETPKGRIVAKLHTNPGENIGRTVANFAERINSGVLDGSTFFRVEDWFVQGGGDPDATSRLRAEYNKIPFTAGSVALAHGVDGAFNSDSQFLIAKTDAPQLNDQYTNLGQVVEGMEIVKKIAAGDKMTKVRVVSDKY